MTGAKEYAAKTEALLEPIAHRLGVGIYDVEYVKEGGDYILRAYIEKDGGVAINDCEAVSHALSEALDVDDFIADAYILEVSSPGLGRRLTKDRHLTRSIGAEVEIKTYKPGRELGGILRGFDREKVIIDDGKREVAINRSEIAVIRLAFHI